MSTVITARAGRVIRSGTFLDLTSAEFRPSVEGGLTTVTFDADLEQEVISAIRDRMTSRDDDDQAARLDLRTKRDAVVAAPSLENVAALAVAEANYQLGETT